MTETQALAALDLLRQHYPQWLFLIGTVQDTENWEVSARTGKGYSKNVFRPQTWEVLNFTTPFDVNMVIPEEMHAWWVNL